MALEWTLLIFVNNIKHRLTLNPYEDLDDKFIDNEDIDADKNYYNIDAINCIINCITILILLN